MKNLLSTLLAVVMVVAAFFVHASNVEVCETDQEGNSVCQGIPKGANREGKPIEVSLANCVDRHQQCVDYASSGECEINPGWMIVNCPRSCNACHLLDPKVRCPRTALNISTDPIYHPGDLQRIFSGIEAKYQNKYGINIISTDPWVVTFENFLTDAEMSALISTVEGTWERSTDTGSTNEFGETGRVLSSGRTSSNAWCRHRCENHPDVKSVLAKIEEITEIPRSHYESFQILRYERGQRYISHHDMSPHQNNLACGPRILTFFLYLSDVEEGGETAFPQLKIAVKPKRGMALLWPSTLNTDPTQQDIRTTHEARPVMRGVKYAANSWIHLYDFQKPNLWGCTGTFDTL